MNPIRMAMLQQITTNLKFAPTDSYVTAQFLRLSPKLVSQMLRQWWSDECLLGHFNPEPIDRRWKWTDTIVERKGIVMNSDKIGLRTAPLLDVLAEQ